jgi:glycosyltransferase involved in cell wall biosynthesis
MKILHFLIGRCNPESANGVDKAVYFLTKAQSKKGHEVFLFSLTNKTPISLPGITIKNFVPSKSPFCLPESLLKEVSTLLPDIVHFHSVFTPQNIKLAKLVTRKKIPYIVTPHGGLASQALRKSKLSKLLLNKLFERDFWDKTLFVHAIGEIESKHILNYGIKRPIVIAPHAIDPEEIPDRKLLDKSYFEKNYPQTKNKRIFLFLGRLDTFHKGLDILLESFAKLRESSESNILILAGPDWRGERAVLEKLVEKLELQNNVIFIGPKFGFEKFEVINSADVFVHPSRYEAAIPFSVLEAVSMGKPCLLTKSIGFQLIDDKDIDLQVEATVEDLSEGLKYFTSRSKDEIQKIGERGREKVFQNFSWEKTVDILESAFRMENY